MHHRYIHQAVEVEVDDDHYLDTAQTNKLFSRYVQAAPSGSLHASILRTISSSAARFPMGK